jgi:hypothetical protein
MELERYLALDRILPAFKFRDIQATATILAWVFANNFTAEDIRAYAAIYPQMDSLNDVGYFQTGDTAHSKRVKEFERTLPVETKRLLRKERMRRLSMESPHPRKP